MLHNCKFLNPAIQTCKRKITLTDRNKAFISRPILVLINTSMLYAKTVLICKDQQSKNTTSSNATLQWFSSLQYIIYTMHTHHTRVYLIPLRVKVIINDLSLLFFTYIKNNHVSHLASQQVKYTCKRTVTLKHLD